MKKLITTFLALFVIISSGLVAQTGWDNYLVTGTLNGQGNFSVPLDTMYVAIACRNGKYEVMSVNEPGVLTATGLTAASYEPQDSVTWMIVKGAALGTTPRVRFINLRTGEYLYVGAKDGTDRVGYVAAYDDPFNGVKDFELRNQGTDGRQSYHYFIADGQTQFFNDVAGAINVKTGTSTQGWKFIPRPGPQPKATKATVTMSLTAVESSVFAGGDINLNAKVTKGSTDLLGEAILYYGKTVLDTLELNASGEASFKYEGLVYGDQTFVLVYTGDVNYGAEDVQLPVLAGPDPSANVTKASFSIAESATLYDKVDVSISIATAGGAAVTYGNAYVMVDSVVTNELPLDVLGTATITFPNLVKNSDISVFYIGDKMLYLDSDTITKTITINPSTAAVKPYPVYFNVTQYPGIEQWTRENVTAETVRPFSYQFTQDSLMGVTLELDSVKITYEARALSYTSGDTKDYYAAADNLLMPLGSGRSKWVNFKTPWLNAGAYNVYLSHRHSGDAYLDITSVTMNDEEVFFPGYEMFGRWFRSWANANNKRRWNAQNNNNNLSMRYFGSAKIDASGIQDFRVHVRDHNGIDNIMIDMIQFIPVDQDSMILNQPASVSYAKNYYPMFDLGGFARFEGEAAINTYAGVNEMAVPYQAADPSTYTKTSHTLTGLGQTPTADDLIGNYVTIYRNEDRWTRMAEGYLDESTGNFTAELPNGTYYYQEIFHYDPGTTLGAYNTRYFISDGTFTVGGGVDVDQVDRSTAFAYVLNNTLNVKGMKEGSKLYVVDIAGRVVLNETVTSNTYSMNLPKGMYIVKVVGAESLLTKVIVQ